MVKKGKRPAKGLQKFTDSESKVNQLLAQKTITKEDVASLTREEKDLFQKIASDKLTNLKGDEKDWFISKVEEILPQDTRNQIWEANNITITAAISSLMRETDRMPTKSQIAEASGLSRTTVHPMFVSRPKRFFFLLG